MVIAHRGSHLSHPLFRLPLRQLHRIRRISFRPAPVLYWLRLHIHGNHSISKGSGLGSARFAMCMPRTVAEDWRTCREWRIRLGLGDWMLC